MTDRYDLVIVGMGSAGMAAAEFAATLDLNVAVIERDRVGGDGLWTGSVPSKALLATAKVAHVMRHADAVGLTAVEPHIDLGMVWRRMRSVRADIARTDSDPERYRAMGLTIVVGDATITGPNEVTVVEHGSHTDDEPLVLDTRFIMLCTGSRPDLPEIDGLTEAGYLTSETLFELDEPPVSMVIIGGGPMGIEMAQALNRLGVRVTVLQRASSILTNDEPALVQIVAAKLRSEGVDLRVDAEAVRVTLDGSTRTVHCGPDDADASVFAEGILVATGRRANTEGLGLDEVGVEVGANGVQVDGRGRTNIRSIYAVGDVAGRFFFAHSAGYEGVRAVRDMFFPGKGNVDEFVPWCTFTDPELAHAGLTVAEAEAKFGDDLDVWRLDLSHNDRARADAATEGSIVVISTKGRIVGAHIVAPAAGEMIHELALAIRHDMKIGDIAALVHIAPTYATSIGEVATDSSYERARNLRWMVRR